MEDESSAVQGDGVCWALEQSWSGWKLGTGLLRHLTEGIPAKLPAWKAEVLPSSAGLGLEQRLAPLGLLKELIHLNGLVANELITKRYKRLRAWLSLTHKAGSVQTSSTASVLKNQMHHLCTCACHHQKVPPLSYVFFPETKVLDRGFTHVTEWVECSTSVMHLLCYIIYYVTLCCMLHCIILHIILSQYFLFF